MQLSLKSVGAAIGSVALVAAMAGTISSPAEAGAAKAIPGKVTVTPAVNLKNGQTVSVKGSGFAPNTVVFMVECLDAKGKKCETSSARLRSTKSSATGTISAKYKLYTGKVSTGKCSKGSTCYLAVAQADGKAGQIKKIVFAK